MSNIFWADVAHFARSINIQMDRVGFFFAYKNAMLTQWKKLHKSCINSIIHFCYVSLRGECMRCNWTPAKYMNLLYSIVFPLFYSKELSALYTIEPLSPAHRSRNPIYIAVAVWWYITFTKREQLLCFDEHMIFSDNVFIAFFHSQFCYIYITNT